MNKNKYVIINTRFDENAIVATIADNSAVDTDEDQSEDGTESKQ